MRETMYGEIRSVDHICLQNARERVYCEHTDTDHVFNMFTII